MTQKLSKGPFLQKYTPERASSCTKRLAVSRPSVRLGASTETTKTKWCLYARCGRCRAVWSFFKAAPEKNWKRHVLQHKRRSAPLPAQKKLERYAPAPALVHRPTHLKTGARTHCGGAEFGFGLGSFGAAASALRLPMIRRKNDSPSSGAGAGSPGPSAGAARRSQAAMRLFCQALASAAGFSEFRRIRTKGPWRFFPARN